ncbi:MAG: phage resistance protein, partial [Planctomycetota bacterium]
ETDRVKTVTATLKLVERIVGAEANEVVAVLATADIATTEAAMGECRSKAAELGGTLEGTNWEIFEAIGKLTDERQPEAAEIQAAVERALCSDEHVVQLGPALKESQGQAVRLLTKPTGPKPEVKPVDVPEVQPEPGKRVVDHGSETFADLSSAREKLDKIGEQLTTGREVEVTIAWRIEEGKSVQ